MTTEFTSCPYCNSYVTLTAATVPGQRVSCPRCGEWFPYRPQEVEAKGLDRKGPPVGALAAMDKALKARTTRSGWPNWVIAVLVLGVMAVMAVIGLTWALKTVPERRSRDRVEPIGFLPADSDIVIGMQMVKTLEAPVGRDLTREFDQMMVQAGLPSFAQWTGLRWEDVNQTFLGIKVTERLLPRVVWIVETREEYDARDIRAALSAGKPMERGKKTLYRFRPKGASLELEVWFATKHILVIGFMPSDLEAVPSTAHSGVGHLPQWLQSLFIDPSGANAQAWVMAHADDWEKSLQHSPLGILVERLPASDWDQWSRVQTFAVWLHFGEAIQLTTACDCRRAEDAEALENYLRVKGIVAPEVVERKQGNWVMIRSQTDAATIRESLKESVTAFLKN